MNLFPVKKSALILRAGLLALAISPVGSQAQSFVVPGAFATTSGNASTASIVGTQSRTYQFQIAASELSGFAVGTQLRSLAIRVRSGQSGGSALSFANWNMQIGQATNTIANMSSVFASNMQNAVTVRSGPLSFAANSFPSVAVAPNVNPWGPEIVFTTPYTYQGGDLVLFLNHGPTLIPWDSAVSEDALSPAAAGYGIKYRALRNLTENANIAESTNAFASIIRLSAEPVPEPGTLLLLSSGIAFLKLRRKAKN